VPPYCTYAAAPAGPLILLHPAHLGCSHCCRSRAAPTRPAIRANRMQMPVQVPGKTATPCFAMCFPGGYQEHPQLGRSHAAFGCRRRRGESVVAGPSRWLEAKCAGTRRPRSWAQARDPDPSTKRRAVSFFGNESSLHRVVRGRNMSDKRARNALKKE
jgi:hypothetical protein